MARRRSPTNQQTKSEPDRADRLDVNAVVSYNVKTIREQRGLTQQAVAEHLGRLTGHQLPQASISAMERGFDGERRRRFDAHELYLLCVVFDVPITYFFLPPPSTINDELADTHRPVAELYRALLGTEAQVESFSERLRDIRIEDPDDAGAVATAALGPDGAVGNWHPHFRSWRHARLREIEREYGDRLDDIADFMVDLGSKIKAFGPSGYLHSTAYRRGDPVDDA